MARLPSPRAWAPALLAIVVLLGTWELPLPRHFAGEAEDRLPGTWLREYSERGVQVRRVLALAPDGAFRERVRVVDRQGAATEYQHEGTWLYDGTNLKRRYTLMNGKPPSRLNVPFATFQIAFETRNEFVGVDHIHHNRVHYRRVAPDTRP